MSLKVNTGASAITNLIALVAAANPAFAAQMFQPKWLIVDNVQAVAGAAADANTMVDVAPQTDVTKTNGVIVVGDKKTFTYGRVDLAGFQAAGGAAVTLDPSKLTFANNEYTLPADADFLVELLKGLYGLDALASEFTLSYAAGANTHAGDGGTSTVTIGVAAGALVFDPASAPVVVTLTWPKKVSLDSATTTSLGAFSASLDASSES